MLETVKGKKGTYLIWSERVELPNGAVDVYRTIKYTAKNEVTGKIVKTETIKYPQNVQNSTIFKQIEDWKKLAENDFK